MTFFKTLSELSSLLGDVTKDLAKVERGNRSAAQRVRVRTVRLAKVSKMFREESIEAEKALLIRKKRLLKKRKRR